MSKPYKFGVIIDDEDEVKCNLTLEVFYKNFGRAKFKDLFIKHRTIGNCIYFGDHCTGWNPYTVNHSFYCKRVYSLKNDWAQIIDEPIMAPFVQEKHRAIPELKKPYFPEGEPTIAPPDGYYYLSADDKLEENDLGFYTIDQKWCIVSWLKHTASSNYKVHSKYKDSKVIAFARKAPVLNKNNNKTMNKETIKDLNKNTKICIYCPTEAYGQEVWRYLLSLGYKQDMDERKYEHRKDFKTYIWINRPPYKGIVSADNDHNRAFDKFFENKESLAEIKEYFEKNMITYNTVNNKNMNIERKLSKVAIRVGTSPTLFKMVEELYFSKGIYYLGKKGEPIGDQADDYGDNRCLHNEGKYLQYSPQSFYKENGYIILDAATQMGEIVALFEEPVIKVPEIHGYKASYGAVKDIVTFGCAHLDVNLLRGLANLMDKTVVGNRSVDFITLERGKTLNRVQIREILEYVDAVNSAN